MNNNLNQFDVKQVRFQGIGFIDSIKVEDLQIGMILVWNYSYGETYVKSIEKTSKCFYTLTEVEIKTGKEYSRKRKQGSFVGVVSDKENNIQYCCNNEVQNQAIEKAKCSFGYCKEYSIGDNCKECSNKNKSLGYTGCVFAISKEEIKQVFKEQNKEVIEANNKIHTQDNKEIEKENIKVEVNFNTDKNGIELKFTDKPSEEIRESLKLNGFRWSRFNKVWYAKDTEESRDYLKEVGFLKLENQEDLIKVEDQKFQKVEYPEIEIEDIESYTIDKQLSKRENDNGFFRTKERDHQKELQDYLTSCNKEILEVLKNTDNQKIIYNAKKYLQSYKKKYYNLYLKMLTHKANNPSWVVTGRGGLNVNKYNKQCDRYNNMLKEHSIITEEFDNKIDKIKNEIYKIQKFKEENQINNINENEIKEFDKQFKKVKIKINLSNISNIFDNGNYEVTANQYGDYFIFKNWACWRIYNKNGNEIGQVKTKQTLKDAKKLLYYLINSKAA